jgi:UDP-2,4-diacetamido-2,4,6-trideoxy-beta-L-altropyranose hydrolase
MTNRAITIYAAGGPFVGHGHLMRTMTVAQSLVDGGCRIDYLIDDHASARIVENNGFSASVVEDGLQSLLERAPRYVLVDSYRVTEEWLGSIAKRQCVALFDDGCRLKRYAADFVIDSAPYASRLPYRGRDDTVFLLDSEYFPLRAALMVRPINTIVDQILITFGGADPDDVSSRVVTLVKSEFPSHNFTVVLGGSYCGGLRPGKNERVSIIASPKNLAEHFARACIAIAGAGQTALELAYFGVPSILLRLSPDQEQVAAGLAAQGAALDCGVHATCPDSRIVTSLNQLLAGSAVRRTMKEAGQRVVDGRGAKRVADALIAAWFN